MEKDGWWLRMSLPSSTIEIRCPIPGDGYMTIASIVSSGGVKISELHESMIIPRGEGRGVREK